MAHGSELGAAADRSWGPRLRGADGGARAMLAVSMAHGSELGARWMGGTRIGAGGPQCWRARSAEWVVWRLEVPDRCGWVAPVLDGWHADYI